MSSKRTAPAGASIRPEFTALATAVGVALAAPVVAQDAGVDETVDEVVVEGELLQRKLDSGKFTAPLLDTPKSVTIIPQALIEEQNATNLVEALRNVPGVTFNAGEGGAPQGDNLKIRGFDAGADCLQRLWDASHNASIRAQDLPAILPAATAVPIGFRHAIFQRHMGAAPRRNRRRRPVFWP